MKIGNSATPAGLSQTGGVASTPRDGADAAKSGGATATKSTEGSATVKISSAATALLEGAEGGFDAEKVARVRQSISDGTYKINAGAIADKLIANAHEVLGKSGSSS
jgi:negative regulator of flagellin synthesis FlgM